MNKYNVFDLQDRYPTKKQRLEFVKDLTLEEMNHLISTCGTNQGKTFYKGLYQCAGIIKSTGIKRICFNTYSTLLYPDIHRDKERIEVNLDTSANGAYAKIFTYNYEYNLRKPVSKKESKVEIEKVEEAFHIINEMLPEVNENVMWIDDHSIILTITYADGTRVKVDRGDLANGESIVYRVMDILGLL